jgi:hypothetical protein
MKKERAQIDPDKERNYVRVETMHPCIVKY